VNAAGGNVARARTDQVTPFRMQLDAFDEVVRLNLHGTVHPTLVFGEAMAERKKGSVVNISSMAALRPLAGVAGYSAAKAGIDSFTRWLAVELARHHGPGLRVNAIAPGFFVTTQNKAVLVKPDGSPTERGRAILARTPMGRFGEPAELQGALLWLCSDAASFVTGVVIPIDGGFSADGGI
jgi:NAD(P)-dependent dehydrogenase (short-subunit alcohol dehydrogenase family)